MRLAKQLILTTCALAAFSMPAGAQVAASQPADSITAAAASILGTALKGSIENIEDLGVKLDRPQLMKMLADIVDGAQPAYSYERAYSIIDAGVISLQTAYVDSVLRIRPKN